MKSIYIVILGLVLRLGMAEAADWQTTGQSSDYVRMMDVESVSTSRAYTKA